jgi:hypothetical protein
MADEMSTLPVSKEVSEIVNKLAAKKAKELNLPRLSRTAYAEMVFRDLADKELKK